MALTLDEPVPRSHALTVSELTRQVRHLLEVSFLQVYVEGEISGLSRPSSGHWYFSIKDAKAQIRCAMFRSRSQLVRIQPKDGDQVMLRAKVSLYEARGDFQLIVEAIEPAGLGELQRAIEALKHKLKDEGLFNDEHKQALPVLPGRIGVVTSPTGAAIHDILSVLGRRFPGIPVTLYPTAVQGRQAAGEIAAAIELANRHQRCDVLIVGRGGGSLEDLWPFNEERVARAIFASRIPTVSAVGHEVDFTIADFVADWRAPTPSAAAEKLSPNRQDWLDQLTRLEERLILAARRRLTGLRECLGQLRQRLRDPRRQLEDSAQRLDDLDRRLTIALNQQLRRKDQRFCEIRGRLIAQSPQRRIAPAREKARSVAHRLERAMSQRLERAEQRLRHAASSLDLISPLATLGRGYAIVGSDKDTIVRRADQVQAGDRVTAQLANGRLYCRVEKTEAEQPELAFGTPRDSA
ncbi:exodeoxyribonuclease VII large subunit [Hydrocarboniclastica marina]|uniref:Exodeoxyribonuclease 7 large subunit n=1 Tax=Hydrocarboniclastica marina TaxID=2259620 RepID=A0A4P7XH75_9ALTE|nr:exodeoxyribonuclease VII large subunit [Hydrocarboniclastica marina]QCF25804.1 exodeoxyribonuclease VII large subunit [Hydrocarboniclastica marina]